MRVKIASRNFAGTTLLFLFLCCLASSLCADELTDEDILAGADERIEKYRKADVVLTLLGTDGQPAGDVEVQIEQTRHAFLFGSNIFWYANRIDFPETAEMREYQRYFADLFNFATVGFYWWVYEAKQGQTNHARTERVAAWCRRHGIKVKGHPLVWNLYEPEWLPPEPDKVARLALDRVRDCVERFRGEIDVWDAVNEAALCQKVQLQRSAPKLTAAISAANYEGGPMAFFRDAFRTARRANPDAILIINDYVTSSYYADGVISKLVDEEGRPFFDVIGIQSHDTDGKWNARFAWKVCEYFAKFGVPIHFTEVTFFSGEKAADSDEEEWRDTPESEARQAERAASLYLTLFSHPAVEAITWWDFTDQGAYERRPGLLRGDMTPKPAYSELHKLIKEKCWTKTKAVTDSEGRAAFRGFYGDYRASFAINGVEYDRTFSIKKGGKNDIELSAEN